ncbi:MAG: FAD-dependent oxidoreductase [Gemmatimonadetes bacterium]|nr:FAD-dependent oxidoreductase [Gemmatimonadota bacterium]
MRSGPRVVVVGGGFAGLYAGAYLGSSELGDRGADVLLLSERNYFTFTPLLAEVAAGALGREHVTVAYRTLTRRYRIRFLQARMQALAPAEQVIHTTRGPIPYDYAILALGSEPRFFGNDALRAASLPFATVDDALRIRDCVVQRAELAATAANRRERAHLLSFVIAGGGPAGVEVASEIWHLLRDVLPRHYERLDVAAVTLVEGGDRLLTGFDGGLARRGLELLRGRGIQVRLGTRVLSAGEERIEVQGALGRETIDAGVLVWTAGTAPAAVLGQLDIPRADGGLVAVNQALQVERAPGLYAIGDISGVLDARTGRPYPRVAPIAISQGIRAAANVENEALGRPPDPYTAFHAGKIVSLGDGQALVDILGLALTGRPAWWLYRMAYLLKLVGTKNKIRVASTLALNQFFGRDLTCEC